jgi:hypothetical protein
MPSLGWLLALVVSYPCILATDLLSDTLASWHLLPFTAGALLITPTLRLKLPQALLFAACLGLLVESFRPVPSGAAVFPLMVMVVLIAAWREPLRRRPRPLVSAFANALALAALLVVTGSITEGTWANWLVALPFQVLLAFALGWLIHPLAVMLQTYFLDRAGFSEIHET